MTETNDVAAAPAPASNKKTIILVVCAALLCAAGLAVVVTGPMAGKKMSGESHDAPALAETDGKKGHETAPKAITLIDNLVINPVGTNGQRYLLLSVGLEVADSAAAESFKVRDPEARDIVMTVMGSQRIEQLADPAQRDSLKGALLKAFGASFGAKAVTRVYFPQFVIQ